MGYLFAHTDDDGYELSVAATNDYIRVRIGHASNSDRVPVQLSRREARSLRDEIDQWLSQGFPVRAMPLTPADVRAIATQAATEVMALHLSPQARYEDAVAARLCTVPGCPAFPGAAQHFEHGEPDPEPRDVGHPEPDPCPLVQPLHAHSDARCGGCGGNWRDHRNAFCTGCGHGILFHDEHDGCRAILGKSRCGCARTRPTSTP